MLKVDADDTDRDDLAGSLDELVAAGALRMLMAGLEIEVADYIERHQQLVDEAVGVWWCATGELRSGPW
jgi:hypothetical protein